MKPTRVGTITVITFIAVFATVMISASIGVENYSIQDLFEVISGSNETSASLVFFKLRLPRIIAALAVGGSLALAGVVMQSVFSNPLVEPYTLGLSGSASLGIAIAFVSKLPSLLGAWVIPFCSIAGTVPILLFLLHFSRRVRYNSRQVLLSGVMISYICSSLVTLLLSLTDLTTMGNIVQWGFGSLSGASNLGAISLLIFSGFIMLILLLKSLSLNAISLGEGDALSLGVPVHKLRIILLILATCLTAGAVSLGGVIGFVGLLVPHFLRLIVSNDHRLLIPLAWIWGGVLLLGADTFGRVIILPNEIPVGVISGIFGGGLFLFLIQKKGKSV